MQSKLNLSIKYDKFAKYMEIIYDELNIFEKLHRVLISCDDNLNFIINFIMARWNSLNVPKKVLCVTFFLKNFQNHSIGFMSGE